MQEAAPHNIFYVGQRAYAIWGWDIDVINVEFIESIDPDYFEYVNSIFKGEPETENALRASLVVRANYHHALETLFLLVGAAIQAPHCVPGWISKISTPDLRTLVTAFSEGKDTPPTVFDSESLTWRQFGEAVYQFWAGTNAQKAEQIEGFSKSWEFLASDWLADFHKHEYNAIKHGFRLKPGGFPFRMEVVREEGEPSQPGDVLDLGGSEFGSSFYVSENVGTASGTGYRPNFKLTRHNLNWSVDAMIEQTRIIVLSISNIRHCLLTYFGRASGDYRTIDDPNEFDRAFNYSCGVSAMTFGPALNDEHVLPMTREAIEKEFNSWKQSATYPEND